MPNFRNLTDNQAAVFEQIALNNDAGHNEITLRSLVSKMLIERREEKLDGWPPTVIYRYAVPVPVHQEWCQWCAEQGGEEDEYCVLCDKPATQRIPLPVIGLDIGDDQDVPMAFCDDHAKDVVIDMHSDAGEVG